MEDFPALDLTNIELADVYDKISKYCLDKRDYETGGIVKKDLSVSFFEPIAKHEAVYLPDFDFYLEVINNKKDILFCFHSHLQNDDASEEDLKFIKVYNIPSLIYIINSNKFLSVNTRYEKSRFSWPPAEI